METRGQVPSCLHCGGVLYLDYDWWGKYYTCLNCAREFEPDMKPRRVDE